jgi:hypothetical protein
MELVFREAPWVLPVEEISDPKSLYVSGFHFHRAGHEGYNEYLGQFPAEIVFNDMESDIRRKLGEPIKAGGGGISKILKRPIPKWLVYPLGNARLHVQFDADGKTELVTLFVENPQQEFRAV